MLEFLPVFLYPVFFLISAVVPCSTWPSPPPSLAFGRWVFIFPFQLGAQNRYSKFFPWFPVSAYFSSSRLSLFLFIRVLLFLTGQELLIGPVLLLMFLVLSWPQRDLRRDGADLARPCELPSSLPLHQDAAAFLCSVLGWRTGWRV